MTKQAFKYELERGRADGYENYDVFYTHIECGDPLPYGRTEAVEVTGTHLEYKCCAECGNFLDEESRG